MAYNADIVIFNLYHLAAKKCLEFSRLEQGRVQNGKFTVKLIVTQQLFKIFCEELLQQNQSFMCNYDTAFFERISDDWSKN